MVNLCAYTFIFFDFRKHIYIHVRNFTHTVHTHPYSHTQLTYTYMHPHTGDMTGTSPSSPIAADHPSLQQQTTTTHPGAPPTQLQVGSGYVEFERIDEVWWEHPWCVVRKGSVHKGSYCRRMQYCGRMQCTELGNPYVSCVYIYTCCIYMPSFQCTLCTLPPPHAIPPYPFIPIHIPPPTQLASPRSDIQAALRTAAYQWLWYMGFPLVPVGVCVIGLTKYDVLHSTYLLLTLGLFCIAAVNFQPSVYQVLVLI